MSRSGVKCFFKSCEHNKMRKVFPRVSFSYRRYICEEVEGLWFVFPPLGCSGLNTDHIRCVEVGQ